MKKVAVLLVAVSAFMFAYKQASKKMIKKAQ